MSKTNGVSSEALGAEEKSKVLALKDVKTFLRKDVNACINMLQAIHDDPDAFDALAVVLHGKYMNRLHKIELDKQLEIKP